MVIGGFPSHRASKGAVMRGLSLIRMACYIFDW